MQDELQENPELNEPELLAQEGESFEDQQDVDRQDDEPEGDSIEASEDQGSDLAPEITPKAQKAINKQHRRFREEERKRIALERELEAIKAKEAEALSATADIVVPPMPDQWDDDYEAKIAEREKAIIESAKQAERLAAREASEAQKKQALEAQKAKQMQEQSDRFFSNGKAAGISEADLSAAAGVVANSGISPDVANYLIGDEKGAELTAYLADESNTMDLYELVDASPIAAAEKLIELKGRLQPTAKRETIKPASRVEGKSRPDSGMRFAQGAKFE